MAFTDKLSTREEEDLAAILKQLRGDMDTLREDIRTLSKDAGKAGSASAHAARDTVEDTAEKVIKMSRDKADRIKHDAEEKTESVRNTVRENPIASLGLAVAAGMVIGRAILK